jgi:hypothetical protein
MPVLSKAYPELSRKGKIEGKKALYNEFYEDYQQFCTAILGCLAQTNTTYKEELETLLTPKFQTFTNVTFQPQ